MTISSAKSTERKSEGGEEAKLTRQVAREEKRREIKLFVMKAIVTSFSFYPLACSSSPLRSPPPRSAWHLCPL